MLNGRSPSSSKYSSARSVRNVVLGDDYGARSTGESKCESKCEVDVDVDHYDIIIVGGGITGLATAVGLTSPTTCLTQREYSPPSICVLEKARELKPIGATLGLFPNGKTALSSISKKVADSVIESGIEYKGTVRISMGVEGDIHIGGEIDEVIHDSDRQKSNTGKNGGGDSSGGVNKNNNNKATLIAWFKLQQYLAGAIDDNQQKNKNISLQLGKMVESFTYPWGEDENNSIIAVHVKDLTNENENSKKMTCKLLIGADGINSIIRDILFADEGEKSKDYEMRTKKKTAATKYKYHNRVMYRAILQDYQFQFNTDVLALLEDGYTVTFKCDAPGKVFAVRRLTETIYSFTASVSVASVDTPMSTFPGQNKDVILSSNKKKKERLRKHFQNYPKEVLHIIDFVSPDAIYENEVWDIDFLDQWYRDDMPIILIGDAAHAMTPKLGQGANMGLEDAAELSYSIGQALLKDKEDADAPGNGNLSVESILVALEEFSNHRVERVREVHRLSRETASLSSTVGKSPDFRDKIYQWKPSFSKKVDHNN